MLLLFSIKLFYTYTQSKFIVVAGMVDLRGLGIHRQQDCNNLSVNLLVGSVAGGAGGSAGVGGGEEGGSVGTITQTARV